MTACPAISAACPITEIFERKGGLCRLSAFLKREKGGLFFGRGKPLRKGAYAELYPHPRRAGAQSEKHRRRRSVASDRRHRRRVRFGQVVAGAGRAVRRGLAPLFRGALRLHAAADDAGRQGAGGRDLIRPRGAGAAPAPRRARHPQHLRHGHRASQQPAPAVFPPRLSPLPQRALSAAHPRRGGGRAAHLPRLRGAVLRPLGGGTLLQRRRGVQGVRRHGHRAHGGQEHPRPRRQPDHRRRRRRPLEQPHVVADDGRLPRHGGAHGRSLQRPHRRGKAHRLRRPRRKEAHSLPRQKRRRSHRARLHLLQRRAHRRKRPCQGQRRERHEAGGKIPAAGRLPRLRRLPPVRSRPRAPRARHLSG